jgi:hypothetical protein
MLLASSYHTLPLIIGVPLLMTFFSAHHSPSTVNKKASELVMGTVKLSSACPIKIKNQMLPVTFSRRGTAYAGRDRTPVTAYQMPSTFVLSHELLGSVKDGRSVGV